MEQDEYEHMLEAFSEEQKQEFDEMHVNGSKIDTGLSLYEVNQKIIKKFANLDLSAPETYIHYVASWIEENPDEYYMLLGIQDSYFTLFHCNSNSSNGIAASLLNILTDFVSIKMIQKDNNGAIAVWGNLNWPEDLEEGEEPMPNCYYFFPYGRGVVEVE